MKAFVTGGAGFIGSSLVNHLLTKNNFVTVYDNFSTGKKTYLPSHKNLNSIKADVLDSNKLSRAIKNHDIVYHLSANADVRKGSLQTDLDLQQETIATYNVLEAMRKNNIKKIVFPSSMTVYGRSMQKKISESYGPCLPISLYAAAKLGNEGMISAYSETFGFTAWIFRFANVIGPHLTHGVIYDLINKLVKNKKKLEVLGDGNQTKPYIYINDVVSAIDFISNTTKEQVNLYNIGVSDTISVKEIVKLILKKMELKKTNVVYAKTSYGWKGDVPQFYLDTTKLKKAGFTPQCNSKKAVKLTIDTRLQEIQYHAD